MSDQQPDDFAVTDDSDAREETRAWAYGEIAGGREPEAVEADLVANGWPADDAAGMVEQARQQSRHRRGVVTRADVARQSEARYRESAYYSTSGGSKWGFLGLLLGFFRSKKPPTAAPPRRDVGAYPRDRR